MAHQDEQLDEIRYQRIVAKANDLMKTWAKGNAAIKDTKERNESFEILKLAATFYLAVDCTNLVLRAKIHLAEAGVTKEMALAELVSDICDSIYSNSMNGLNLAAKGKTEILKVGGEDGMGN